MIAERRSDNGNGNGCRGPVTVDVFLSRRTGYKADIFSGTCFQERKDDLAEIAIDLTVQSGLFSDQVATDMVIKGMNSGVGQNASMILFRKSESPLGKYAGLSWQEIHSIPTTEGEKLVEYLRLRAFKKGHRRIHLGRVAMQLGLSIYSESQPTYFAHRTASPAAALSFLESGVFREGRRFPKDARYDTDPLMQQLLMAEHFRVRNNGTYINMSTGVSIADYPELNGAYEVDETHVPTMEIRRWMIEDLGMDLSRGDSLLEIGELA